MPQRTWGGGSGSSSSGSSSSGSSSSSSSSNSSSSWSSSSSWRRNSYGGGDDGGGSGQPMDPMWVAIWIGIMVLIFITPPILDALKKSGEERDNANATATTHAITQADLAMIHTAIDPRLADWKRDAKIGQAEWLNASDAGFPSGSNTRGVMYGYCDKNETFYVYVLNISQPAVWSADAEGYAYVPNTSPPYCFPAGWKIIDYVSAEESGWYFMIASTGSKFGINSTELPNTVTPLPTSVFKN
ncbi:MAG: hypothetical protein KF716_13280 [Anaerolineae bacterium]|nr:hypothetical protein [Anaerolineae bacterium]